LQPRSIAWRDTFAINQLSAPNFIETGSTIILLK